MPKSEKRKRIEALLIAGERPADIAKAEGVSRQYVSEVKRAMERPKKPQGWKRRPSQAYLAWLRREHPFVSVLEHYGDAVTRENYLAAAYLGNPPAELGAECESMLPEFEPEEDGDEG